MALVNVSRRDELPHVRDTLSRRSRDARCRHTVSLRLLRDVNFRSAIADDFDDRAICDVRRFSGAFCRALRQCDARKQGPVRQQTGALEIGKHRFRRDEADRSDSVEVREEFRPVEGREEMQWHARQQGGERRRYQARDRSRRHERDDRRSGGDARLADEIEAVRENRALAQESGAACAV